jgi:hypothetical protein
MDGVNIVVFLVHCTAGLLLCDTLPSDNLRFNDPETCRSAAATLIAARRDPTDSGVWMADCRYRLAGPDPRRVLGAQAAPSSHVAFKLGSAR